MHFPENLFFSKVNNLFFLILGLVLFSFLVFPFFAQADSTLNAHPAVFLNSQPTNVQLNSALQATTNALTGGANAQELTNQSVCSTPLPGHVTCDAADLVNQNTGQPVHPVLDRPGITPNISSPHFLSSPAVTSVDPFTEPAGSDPPVPGTPAAFQQAYDLTGLAANVNNNDTIAVVDAYWDPEAASDMATYRSQFGLSSCTTNNGCFQQVNQTGGNTQMGSTCTPSAANQNCWIAETALDLESISAICPYCHINLVEATTDVDSDMLAAESEAAALNPDQISDSWSEESQVAPFNSSSFSYPGISVVAAAGDNGYQNEGSWPAAYDSVTSVGGTDLLQPGSTGLPTTRGWEETAWSGTNSACANTNKPSWQTDGGCAQRMQNDISADADPATGIDIYFSGAWYIYGGTSLATPLTAAYYGLIQNANENSAQLTYQDAAALNDITSGSNSDDSCSSYLCNAELGYDGPTGNGSLSGSIISSAPGIAGASQITNTYTSSVSANSVNLAAGIYPNQEDTSYYWEYAPDSYYQENNTYNLQTVSVDIGAGDNAPNGSGGLVPISDNIGSLATDTEYDYRLVATNPLGTTYGYNYTFTTGSASPRVNNLEISSLTASTATISATIDPNGENTYLVLNYGTSPAYGDFSGSLVLSGTSSNQTVSLPLTNLNPSTTYYFQIVTESPSGSDDSDVQTFQTEAPAATITDLPVTNIGPESATVNATVNTNIAGTTYTVTYGTDQQLTTATGAITTPIQILSANSISVILNNLTANTTYYYQYSASNANGVITGALASFQTTSGAPTIDGLSATVTDTSATCAANINPNGVDTTFSFTVQGPEGSVTATPYDMGTDSGTDYTNISNLEPGTNYTCLLTAQNSLGSAEQATSFTTLGTSNTNPNQINNSNHSGSTKNIQKPTPAAVKLKVNKVIFQHHKLEITINCKECYKKLIVKANKEIVVQRNAKKVNPSPSMADAFTFSVTLNKQGKELINKHHALNFKFIFKKQKKTVLAYKTKIHVSK